MNKYVHIVFCHHHVGTMVVGVYQDLIKAESTVEEYAAELEDDSDFDYYIQSCLLE